MANWLNRSQRNPPPPLVLYKRVEKVEWTKEDAAAWGAVLESPTWKKIEAFMQDRIINGHLAGGDKQFLKGMLYGLASLEGFKGEGNPEREPKPEDLVPIQFFDDTK